MVWLDLNRRLRDGLPVWAYGLALIVIAVLSRLPQLTSPNLLLDGDECILGLMAKHLAEGREFPIFFYGQNYGLSVVEVSAAALNFLIFSVGAVPFKTAMLTVWIVGILFYNRAFSRLLGNGRSFWITLIVILTPAWAVWSMKGRGGYLTAFSAFAGLLYVLARTGGPRQMSWGVAGWLTSVIYFAQPIWLPGTAPIVLFHLLSGRRLSSGFWYVSGIVSMLLLINMVPTSGVEHWKPPSIGNQDLLTSLPRVARQLYVNLTGSYYLASSIDPGPVTVIVAYLWLTILAAVLLLQIYRLVSRRYLLWSHLLCIAVVSTLLANWVLLEPRDGRYLLPLSALLVFLVGVEVFDLVDRGLLSKRTCRAALLVVPLLGAVSLTEFRDFAWWRNPKIGVSEAKRLEAVIDYLRVNGARRVFSLNPMLQWRIMFHSNEEIISRWVTKADRYPAYVSEVDRALGAGETVGLVGYVNATGGLELLGNPEAIFKIDERYFVYVRPNKDLLEKLGFAFAK